MSNEAPSNLPPEYREMIERGKAIRAAGGLAYTEAAAEEREDDKSYHPGFARPETDEQHDPDAPVPMPADIRKAVDDMAERHPSKPADSPLDRRIARRRDSKNW
jgi:hypothetical protein